MGTESEAAGTESEAVGTGAAVKAAGTESKAVGTESEAVGTDSEAVGDEATAQCSCEQSVVAECAVGRKGEKERGGGERGALKKCVLKSRFCAPKTQSQSNAEL